MLKNRCVRALLPLACAALLMTGCKLAGLVETEVEFRPGNSAEIAPSMASAATTPSMAPDPVRIIYRTKTDRLNLAGSSLPPCSMATLQIQVPHPHLDYKSNVGYARLLVLPCSVDGELKPDELPQHAYQAGQIWEGDVPIWQIDAVVRQMTDANFFRRAKVFGAESFLSIDASAGQLGKPYRDVAELDGMILRLSRTSPDGASPASRPDLARLPALSSH